jgi:hypothetical protein
VAESTLQFLQHNFIWGRVENVDRTNELLLDGNPQPPGFDERFLARVQACSIGYDRELKPIVRLSPALGGQITLYGKPASLDTRTARIPSA